MQEIKFGKWNVSLPGSRLARIILGILLIIGGMLGFLPILGFWMIPLGLLVLSVDLSYVRRWRRRFVTWWYNGPDRQAAKEQKQSGSGE